MLCVDPFYSHNISIPYYTPFQFQATQHSNSKQHNISIPSNTAFQLKRFLISTNATPSTHALILNVTIILKKIVDNSKKIFRNLEKGFH